MSVSNSRSSIEVRRGVVDFADVYVQSVEDFIKTYEAAEPKRG